MFDSSIQTASGGLFDNMRYSGNPFAAEPQPLPPPPPMMPQTHYPQRDSDNLALASREDDGKSSGFSLPGFFGDMMSPVWKKITQKTCFYYRKWGWMYLACIFHTPMQHQPEVNVPNDYYPPQDPGSRSHASLPTGEEQRSHGSQISGFFSSFMNKVRNELKRKEKKRQIVLKKKWVFPFICIQLRLSP